MPVSIFVFGSNLQGIHGAGAAAAAKRFHGAIQGQGIGLQGASYAIPTKSTPWKTLPLCTIEQYVKQFLNFALTRSTETFYVTKIGCGLAGYNEEDISPMFANAPENCILPTGWRK